MLLRADRQGPLPHPLSTVLIITSWQFPLNILISGEDLHTTAAEFLDDAVVRDGLTNEG
jgi:hypothetical protein